MAAVDLPLDRDRAVPQTRFALWSVSAAGLLLASSGLQLNASLQRWVVFGRSWTRDDRLVEDNLFDYSYPTDPWENLGTTAETFGAGYLLLSLGVVAVMHAAAPHQTHTTRMLARVVAGSFAVDGGHAVVSGLLDSPSPVQHVLVAQWVLSLTAFVCLIILAVMSLPASRAVSLACLFLVGATVPGYLCASYAVAPIIIGYQSYDTTPWTETIVAGSTAAAGFCLLAGVAVAAFRRGTVTRTVA